MYKTILVSFILCLVSASLFAQPAIISIQPRSGAVGSTVVINGNNFSSTPAANTVYFGAVKAIVTAATSSTLTVTVPAGATYSPVTVTTSGVSASSLYSFVVTFYPNSYPFSESSFDSTMINLQKPSFWGNTPTLQWIFRGGDLDGDGKIDLVARVTNQTANNTLAIYKNTTTAGNISFASLIDLGYFSGLNTHTIYDINSDGKLDIIIGNRSSGISVLLNTSSSSAISFAAPVSFPAGTVRSLVVCDINLDGKPDIATINYSDFDGNGVPENTNGTLSILKNVSTSITLAFNAPQIYTVGKSPLGLAASDIDGDGKADLAVSHTFSTSTIIFKNNSAAGTIVMDSVLDLGVSSNSLAFGDIDGDSKEDLVVSTTGILRNISTPGAISFAPHQYASNMRSGNNVTLADLDGDGKPEILDAEQSTQYPFSFTGNIGRNISTVGSPAFDNFYKLTKTDELTGVIPDFVADLDSDGKPEIGVNALLLYKNKFGRPVITSFTPIVAGPGSTVRIKGYYFTTTQKVFFDRTEATSFTVSGDTVINAVVGAGSPGNIIVTNSIGSSSKGTFYFDGPSTTLNDITSGNGFNTLTWSHSPNVSNVRKFKLYRSTSPNASVVLIDSLAKNLTTFKDQNLTNGVSYYYRIRVVDLQGNELVFSNEKIGKPINKAPVIGTFPNTYIIAGRTLTGTVNLVSPTANDTDGYIDSTAWYIGNRRIGPGLNMPYTFPIGTTKLKYIVYDNQGGSDTAECLISVYAAKGNVSGNNNGLAAYNKQNIFITVNGLQSYLRRLDSMCNANTVGGPTYIFTNADVKTSPSITNDSIIFIPNGASVDAYKVNGTPWFNSAAALGGNAQHNATIDTVQKRIYIPLVNGVLTSINYSSRAPSVAWSYYTGSPGYGPFSSPAVITADRKLLVTTADGNLTGFDLTSLNESNPLPKWSYAVSTSIKRALAVDAVGNVVIVDEAGLMHLLKLESNGSVTELWQKAIPNDSVRTDVVIDAQNNFYAGTAQGKFLKINGSNGNTLSTYQTDFAVTGSPLLSRYGRCYFLNKNNEITALNTQTMQQDWYFKLQSNTVPTSLLHLNGAVYVHDGNYMIQIYDKPDSVPFYRTTSAVEAEEPVWGTYQGNYRNSGQAELNKFNQGNDYNVCPGSGTTIAILPVGGVISYKWQVDDGSGFVDIVSNNNYSGENTYALRLSNLPSSMYGYKYRCLAIKDTNTITSDIKSIKFFTNWIGTANSNWESPANWSCGVLPDQNTDVVIKAGSVKINSHVTIRSLSVKQGVNVTITSGNVLTMLH